MTSHFAKQLCLFMTVKYYFKFIMNSSYYKYCIVPQCKTTTIKTPNKLFIYVPNNKQIRRKWLEIARRQDAHSLSTDSTMYFCEDHFDLPNDMENYVEYHVMGTVAQIRMKPGCIPSKFQCQTDRRKRTSSATTERQYVVKKQRKMLIEEYEKEIEETTKIATKKLESESSVLQTNTTQDAQMTTDKCIQIRYAMKEENESNDEIEDWGNNIKEENEEYLTDGIKEEELETIDVKEEVTEWEGGIENWEEDEETTENQKECDVKKEIKEEPESNDEVENWENNVKEENGEYFIDDVKNEELEIIDFMKEEIKEETQFVNDTEKSEEDKHTAENKKRGLKEQDEERKVVVTEEKPVVTSFDCLNCGESFKNAKNFNVHKRIHTEDFTCNICHKRFTVKASLKAHFRIHTGEKPHECNICHKTFTTKFNLKTHLQSHTGKKPHACVICNKTFAVKSYLKCHSRIHTGDKPYQCDICKKNFSGKTTLKRHLFLHTGEKPHQCDICHKSFTYKCDLKRHLHIHTGKKS